MISDSDTDCSIIDLVNNNSEVTGRQEEEDIIDPMRIDQEEEDGYLSPLEGYTNLRDNQDNQEFNQYFAQLEQAPVQSKKRSYTRNTTRNTTRKRKFYKKRKKDILKSTKSKA